MDDKTREIDSRIIRIRLVDGTSINGYVNINREQKYDRLSDLVGNSGEDFLVLFDVTYYPEQIENPVRHKVLFVNKRHIIWAAPDEDQR